MCVHYNSILPTVVVRTPLQLRHYALRDAKVGVIVSSLQVIVGSNPPQIGYYLRYFYVIPNRLPIVDLLILLHASMHSLLELSHARHYVSYS